MTARNDDIGDSLGEDLKRQQEERRRKARLAATNPVAKAAKLLGVPADAELRRDVKLARVFVERLKKSNRVLGVIRTKPERKAMERFYGALLELRHASWRPELEDHFLLMGFAPEAIDGWIRYSKKVLAETQLGNPAVKGFVSTDTAARRHAAKAAARILKRYALPLKVTRKRVERSGVAARPASKFYALAAIIYGEPSADLFNHCLAVKAALDRNAV